MGLIGSLNLAVICIFTKGIIMNDKFDDLKRDLQELADEYNICLFGLAAGSFHDMEQCRYNQFRC